MKNDEILESNILLFEFMAWNNTGMSVYKKSDYKFHSDFGWLMSCFDKLRLLGYKYTIQERTCTIESFIQEYSVTTIYETTLLSCYNGIVQFINHYNKQKQL